MLEGHYFSIPLLVAWAIYTGTSTGILALAPGASDQAEPSQAGLIDESQLQVKEERDNAISSSDGMESTN